MIDDAVRRLCATLLGLILGTVGAVCTLPTVPFS